MGGILTADLWNTSNHYEVPALVKQVKAYIADLDKLDQDLIAAGEPVRDTRETRIGTVKLWPTGCSVCFLS